MKTKWKDIPLKFKVGDRVSYIHGTGVLFSGRITKALKVRGCKPYTILADDGTIKFANESYIKLES